MDSNYNIASDFNYWHDAPSPQFEQKSPTSYPLELYKSLPLARYASSSGSSQTSSSIPDSPHSLQISTPTLQAATPPAPEFIMSDSQQQHINGYMTSSPVTSPVEDAVTPRSEVTYPGRDWPVFCLMPGCTARPFRRCADLQRHYKNTHAPDSLKDSYLCDYPKCTRSREPFHRRDHFRDHLREYHREDIQKRGNVVNEDWLEGRYLPSTWWRCPRCLVRVYISKHGFECPGCKTSCESKRKERRRRCT